LLGAVVGIAIAISAAVIVVGSNDASIVSVDIAGGTSPSLAPGDLAGDAAAGGDGGGPSGQNPDGAADGATSPAGADPSTTAEQLVIEVAGAVARPGVYHLSAGARVADAIAAAGGYGPRIDIARATAELNLAARVGDGDRIIVPSRDDPATGSGPGTAPGSTPGPSSAPAHTGPVDLNTATAEELDTLPGVGPVTVGKIIASRASQAFRSVSDLRTRKLVGVAEYARIEKLVTVR
jgi:competence protein ComEA